MKRAILILGLLLAGCAAGPYCEASTPTCDEGSAVCLTEEGDVAPTNTPTCSEGQVVCARFVGGDEVNLSPGCD